jgi:hypothetical protein
MCVRNMEGWMVDVMETEDGGGRRGTVCVVCCVSRFWKNEWFSYQSGVVGGCDFMEKNECFFLCSMVLPVQNM